MSDRFLRHHIVGSEAGRPRPIAYLRGGWSRRRSRPSGRRRLMFGALALFIAAMALAAAGLGYTPR